MTCLCGLPHAYPACCGRYHGGAQHLAAPTAEALMRSRYTAYVLKDEPYLLATWHDSTRPAALDLANDHAKWLGLEIKRRVDNLSHRDFLRSQKNGACAAHAPNEQPDQVEFVARHKVGGRAHRLHETSRFVFEDGRWFYLDGKIHTK